ncbi:patatin-like phospholipase family protein [Methylobacterium sp. NEAU 140]|uniref:patatin-like phospholipase family protein n=1 Tax=Methylobacterium sp. NEAU 140 TaxID=3064945 RepID=UPI002735CE88|nr:patatin-like phospholipase family protein [Methylobacterium sp. NEAU 140]MDP4026085.1 patatin-like phospholipase family protein [Methylobacterium sp. NEAU 140]
MTGATALPGSDLALVFGGGNALGAYHAGAFESLDAAGLRPDWVVGASVGAVTAALIAGNPPERRLERLRQFWAEARQETPRAPAADLRSRQVYNGLHVALALAAGRPSIYRHRLPGLWSALPWVPNDVALYDHAPLGRTLERLVDFDRLNGGETRLTVACVDVETGSDVYFDSGRTRIGPEHVLASAAILPAFPPVEIEGRLLCDAGYTNNLPLDPVLADEPERDRVCIALDLFASAAPRPASLDAVLERANDLIFAGAPRRTIAALEREYALRQRFQPDGPTATLLHAVYRAGPDEVAGKSFDYSPASLRDRWSAGRADMARGLDILRDLPPDGGRFRRIALSEYG